MHDTIRKLKFYTFLGSIFISILILLIFSIKIENIETKKEQPLIAIIIANIFMPANKMEKLLLEEIKKSKQKLIVEGDETNYKKAIEKIKNGVKLYEKQVLSFKGNYSIENIFAENKEKEKIIDKEKLIN